MKDFHMLRHRLASLCLAVVAVSVLSCTDSTSPNPSDTRDPTDLRLLTAPYGTPSLAKTQVSFYAVQGKAGGVDIWYHAKPGATDSLKFLEFRVGAGSLATRPDGSAIAAGDSVLITLTVTDQSHFIVDFQPSGLRFASSDQPTLTISFAACGEDLNYDGVVNSTDQDIMTSLSFWRQESPFQPWVKVSSTVQQNIKQVSAQLGGFTGYALEY
ncbi:MAG TPA: hypothetical protein VFY85_00545 [Gemmatimonadaceae bacterium]|nr:hypothetical protein [Gemmatimonadaceae bacterium]